jgi:hypothetical protein
LDWLDTADRLSRTFAIVAVPIIFAVGGWLIQRRLQKQTVSRDYVQLAVTILENPDTLKVPPELREWAVDLLNENSPTKLNAKAIESLKSGAITLPSFKFVSSEALTPGLKAQLEKSLHDFQEYLANLGFTRTSQMVSVDIRPGTKVKIRGTEAIAVWDDETCSIVVASAFASDQIIVLRQLAHHLLNVPDAPSPWTCHAIKSGLATYFPCSFSDHPIIGDKASKAGRIVSPLQNLSNRRRFNEIQLKEWWSIQNDGSEIWGGTFWQIRELVGPASADRLLAEAWWGRSPVEQEGEAAFVAFASDLVNRSKSIEHGTYTERFRAVFDERGLPL